MPREVEISNIERNFILEALEQSVRLDGRSLDQGRNIDLEFGDEYGTVTLRLGKTRSVRLVSSKCRHPTKGNLIQGLRTGVCRSH